MPFLTSCVHSAGCAYQSSAVLSAQLSAGTGSGLVTLKGAVANGITSGLSYRALDNLRTRYHDDFPQPARWKSSYFGAHYYDPDKIEHYCEQVVMARREKQGALL